MSRFLTINVKRSTEGIVKACLSGYGSSYNKVSYPYEFYHPGGNKEITVPIIVPDDLRYVTQFEMGAMVQAWDPPRPIPPNRYQA